MAYLSFPVGGAEQLYRRHYAKLYRELASLTDDPHAAADALQEAFLVALRRLDQLRDPKAFEAWVLKIALNKFRQGRRKCSREVLVQDEPAPPVHGCSAEEQALDKDQRRAAVAAVRALPPKYFDAVVLYYVKGLTIQQTATVLGIPDGTVKSRLAWARKRLQQRLAESAGG